MGVGYDLVPRMHLFTAIETFGAELMSDYNIEKVLNHPDFMPTAPGWQVHASGRDCEERSFWLTVKLETQRFITIVTRRM